MRLAHPLTDRTSNQIPSHIDMVAFSPVRWNHLWRRPQHLMTRFAKHRRVFYVQDPVVGGRRNYNEIMQHRGVTVIIPHLKDGARSVPIEMRRLVHELFMKEAIVDYILWYGAPSALIYTTHLAPAVTIYDCMQELSSSPGFPCNPREAELNLLARADVVFTKGITLFKHKRPFHSNIHAIPGGADLLHFQQARHLRDDPPDQAEIPHPRIGYCGTIDERFDFQLLASLAKSRPHWQFLLLGPVANLNASALLHERNVHYLGRKRYSELPQYMAGWDVTLLPYAVNEKTIHFNPGKLVEYLAAGRPVVSTPLPDVVQAYGRSGLVHIADGHAACANAISRALSETDRSPWLRKVDAFLGGMNWDCIWMQTNSLIAQAFQTSPLRSTVNTLPFVEAFGGRKVSNL